MAGPIKLWRVGSGGQEHANFVAVFRILIIMFNAFANFRRGNSNNRVSVRVIVGRPVEDFHTEEALFELVGLASQGTSNHKPQEPRIPLAGME